MPHWLKSVIWVIMTAVYVAATVLAFLWVTGKAILEPEIGYSLWGICITGVITMLFQGLKSRKEKTFKGPKDAKILPYLEEFIKSGDELAIFSTSFSWINDEIKQSIKLKLEQGREVLFFIPTLNDKTRTIAEELEGLEVREYNQIPHIRFTLLNRNTPSQTKLRVGQPVDTKFTITEFTHQRDGELVSTMSLLVELAKNSIDKFDPAQ